MRISANDRRGFSPPRPYVSQNTMTFVTRLTLRSGDRVVLDETVSEIKTFVSRKGAEMKGPHPRPPTSIAVPMRKRLECDAERFSDWSYTVYIREVEIVGHDSVARAVASRSFPPSLQVVVEVEHVRTAG